MVIDGQITCELPMDTGPVLKVATNGSGSLRKIDLWAVDPLPLVPAEPEDTISMDTRALGELLSGKAKNPQPPRKLAGDHSLVFGISRAPVVPIHRLAQTFGVLCLRS